MTQPFAVPSRLSPDLQRVHAYWRGLLRGSAETPFSDDLRLTDLPDLADRLFVVDVFARPERFRLAVVGKGVGKTLSGCFLDEVKLGVPLDFLAAQCAAAVEAVSPTFHRGGGASPYGRLVLPLWGDGHVSMLLGAVGPA